jgi:gamma-glutamylcyclotransferase (GGCT)/AIG2-like uncharacterized protein YtfP
MLIFVYGTLKQGFGNHRLLANQEYIGRATTPDRYTMLSLGAFPGVVDAGSYRVYGEVYDVDDECLSDLDSLEGHPDFYRRTPIVVNTEDGDELEVETYLLPEIWIDGKHSIVQSGEWSRRPALAEY